MTESIKVELKTRFKEGDEVWYSHLGEPKSGIVTKISVVVRHSPQDTEEQCEVWYRMGDIELASPECFSSKEKLLESKK